MAKKEYCSGNRLGSDGMSAELGLQSNEAPGLIPSSEMVRNWPGCAQKRGKRKGSLDTIIAQQEKRKRVLVVFTQKNKKVEIEGGEKKNHVCASSRFLLCRDSAICG